MEDLFSVLVPIFVIVSVVSSIVKANSKKTKSQNHNYNKPVNKPTNYNNAKPNYNKPAATVAKPKVEEVFDFKNYKTETPGERRARQDVMYNTKPMMNSSKPIINTTKPTSNITKPVTNTPKPINISNIPAKKYYGEGDSSEWQDTRPINLSSWNDKHPYAMAQKQKEEKVYIESTSTDKNSEGCEEHYDSRLVMVDKITEQEISFTELQKMIVFGEIINTPKFKEY